MPKTSNSEIEWEWLSSEDYKIICKFIFSSSFLHVPVFIKTRHFWLATDTVAANHHTEWNSIKLYTNEEFQFFRE